jgi:DNA primase
VLYRLPAVIEAAKLGKTIFLVGGEKDVHALERCGCVATCNPMGAGKWRKEYGKPLRGARVVVIPDADPVGRQHACTVAHALEGVAASAVVLDLAPDPTTGTTSPTGSPTRPTTPSSSTPARC